MFNNSASTSQEDTLQFPPLLTEPWRVQELVENESIIQRYGLFVSITWLRILLGLSGLLVFVFAETNLVSLFVMICYLVLQSALLLRSRTQRDAVLPRYGFFCGLSDVMVLGYLVTLFEHNFELGFLFFSIVLSAMILPFLHLLIILILASLVVLLGWSKLHTDSLIHLLTSDNWSILNTDISNIFNTRDIEGLIILLVGLFVLAIIINRLAQWSFRNEVKARFRHRQLRQVLAFNHSVVEHLKNGVIVMGADGKIININRRAVELLNLNSSEAVLSLSDLSNRLVKAFRQWLSSGLKGNFTYRHNSSAAEVFVSFSRFGQSEQNNIIMMTLEDVDDAMQQTQETRLASLGRLTASVAHEIRNPLSSINSAAELMTESSHSAQHIRLSEMILNNVKRTNRIVNDILSLFKDTRSQHELLAADEILEAFRKEFVLSNKERDFEMTVINAEEGALYFLFDPGQLDQVLWNLAYNALKYANADALKIILKYSLSTDRKNIYLDIIDNGQGIAPEKAGKIFEPFFTGSTSGTGLGLYLVRELCSANNAHVQYLSPDAGKPKHGAYFRISAQVYFSKNIKPKIS